MESPKGNVAHVDVFDIKFVIDCGTIHLKTTSSYKFDPIFEDLRKYTDNFPHTKVSPIDQFKNAIETNCFLHLYDRQVVLIIPIFVTAIKLQSISQYLFDQHNVRSILPLYDCLAALFPLGVSTGLVIDFGYGFTHVSPVNFYVPILKAAKVTSTATKTLFKSISAYFREMLNKLVEKGLNMPKFTSSDEIILNNMLYFNDAQMAEYLPTLGLENGLDFPSILKEFLFYNSDIDYSVTETILESLLDCPIDSRKLLASNLVVTGGIASIPYLRYL
ncbi:actin [Thelohanellus kitauei]|uniref:Actin n=1 Tax=Thelohanellus kitauei TaxID=669202 RepID=A0A0C2IUB3_THEKT|nr:actin [Thelohanellus kitauei]